MNDDVIRALLCEKANLIKAGVSMPADSEEREINDAAIALLDLQIRKCRERREVRARREREAVKVLHAVKVA